MNEQLAQVGLRRWPFDVVPPLGPSSVWYGRPGFRDDLERVVASWGYRSSSSIYLLWADFGAGKTHALRFLEGLCSRLPTPALCVYAELPADVSDFHGVYQQIARQLPEVPLRTAIARFRAEKGTQWLDDPGLNGDRDTPRVLWTLSEFPNDEMGDLARRWLGGSRLPTKELNRLGGVTPVRTSDDARRVLATLRFLMVEHGGYSRFVLLLDEFQRVGQTSLKNLRDVNSGLHTFYNACPQQLTLVLSYSIGIPDAIKHLVSDELMSRVEEKLSLPMLSREEACQFVHDILTESALPDTEPAVSAAALSRIVEQLDIDSEHTLTPRRLMQAMGAVYQGLLSSREPRHLPLSAEGAMELYRTPTPDSF